MRGLDHSLGAGGVLHMASSGPSPPMYVCVPLDHVPLARNAHQDSFGLGALTGLALPPWSDRCVAGEALWCGLAAFREQRASSDEGPDASSPGPPAKACREALLSMRSTGRGFAFEGGSSMAATRSSRISRWPHLWVTWSYIHGVTWSYMVLHGVSARFERSTVLSPSALNV